MQNIRFYDAASSFKEITADILPKLQNMQIKESINGEADSITLNLKNNQNSKDYWNLNYFDDRNLYLKITVDNVNFGVFNFDEFNFDFNESGNFITMNGLVAPVTTGKSIYQQVRKVWELNDLKDILSQIAKLANLELVYLFDDFKLKLDVQNEYLFNIFTRLAEKYGCIVKVFRESETENYKILFYGKKDLAENAALLKKSEIADTLSRGAGLIIVDKNDMNSKIFSLNFRLTNSRKELKVQYYDPQKEKTYTKIGKNKSRLIIEDSRRDFEIVKVTSKSEADIVARKVEEEPILFGSIFSAWNPDFLAGNIIEFKNYSTLDGFYLIAETRHNFGENESNCSVEFERLPDDRFAGYLV